MDINYDYYRVFYYVAKYGSFSRAAEMLGSNQPNVTKLMNKLEDQLDCKLMLRSNKGVRLTSEGETLFAHVDIACRQLRQAEQALSGSRALSSGTVRIGATETALHGILLPVLADFHRQYPGIRLMISNHSTPQAVTALKKGTVDLAVVTTPTEAPPDMRQTRLLEFREILVSAVPAPGPLSLAEVVRQPIVGLGRHSMTFDFYTRLFRAHHLIWQPDIDAATEDQVLPLVKANLGMGFLPEFMAEEAVAKGEVFPIPLTEAVPVRQIVLLEESGGHRAPAVRRFREFLLQSPAF